MTGKYFVLRKDFKAYGGNTFIMSSHNTITAARKAAYSIVSREHVDRCVIKIGDGTSDGIDVGEVLMHHAGAFEGKRFFYPDYHGYYKGSRAQWHKYILKADGTIGKGMW